MVARGDAQVAQVLVQRSQLPTDLTSWEDYDSLKQLFPAAPDWGQARFRGRECEPRQWARRPIEQGDRPTTKHQ
jgi:hypothetical protein